MKQLPRYLFAAVVIFGSLTACNNDNNDNNGRASLNTNQSTVPMSAANTKGNQKGNSGFDVDALEQKLLNYSMDSISQDEIDDLVWIREEEKLAGDVYQALANLHGLQAFTNVADSEATHTSAVRVLLNRYDIADPAISTSMGVFINPTLQDLYNDLVSAGTPSLNEALVVGVMIEELDISDLHAAIERLSQNEDIKMVYENLTKGSRNHLRSFYSQLISRGGTYTPQYISEEEFADIINSPMETGN